MQRRAARLSVLHLSQPVDGGVGRVVSQLVADQVARGWRVVVASPANVDAPLGEFLAGEVRAQGGEHVVWPASRAPGLGLVRELVHLRRIVAAVGPDLVHLHSSKAGLDGRLLLRGRTPTVYQPHAWSFLALRRPTRAAAALWERMGARWSDAVICVSDGERCVGIDAGVTGALRVIPNGVPVPHDRDHDGARRRLGLDDGQLVVCVGRLARQKGQDVLLDAWRSVVRRSPAARLVLVGDGPDHDRLLAREERGVVFAGRRRDVGDWLLAADVVAIPSRWEGMSLTMLDAMARGRAVVSTNVSGSELLAPAACVPVEDAGALAASIVKRLADPLLRKREGSANLDRVSTMSVARTGNEVALLYEDVLAARASAADQ